MKRFNQWFYVLCCRLGGRAKLKGVDVWGNRYYSAPARSGVLPQQERRFVVYKKLIDPSTVTPDWHGWLHHTTNQCPQDHGKKAFAPYFWQKKPLPNLSGTFFAYTPPPYGGGLNRGASPYKAWSPQEMDLVDPSLRL